MDFFLIFMKDKMREVKTYIAEQNNCICMGSIFYVFGDKFSLTLKTSLLLSVGGLYMFQPRIVSYFVIVSVYNT